MKKFCFIICCILMLSMMLLGCGKEENNLNIKEDFVALHSITYQKYYAETHEQEDTIPDKTRQKIFSRFFIEADVIGVTEEEYNSATNKLEDYEYNDYLNATNIKQDKSNIPNISNDNLNIGTTYYAKEYYNEYGDGYYVYRAYTIKSFKVVYVQMKIISDSVIEIIDDDEHYIVQTVYYKANFFN